MNLLPKIPCRKLFVDSRFGEGTSTDFSVDIPEGGLDLGDNTVAYVDQISVPSLQNVFDGRNRIYYKETTNTNERLLYVDIYPWNYSQSGLATRITNTLNGNSNKLITATYDVTYDAPAGFIKFALSGGAAGEGSRILTDQELREMSYRLPYHDLHGSNWELVHYNMAGDWTIGAVTHHVTYDTASRWYNFTPPIANWDRFYMLGKRVFPDPAKVVAGYQFGTFDPAAKTITWGPGGPIVWSRAVTPLIDVFALPMTIRSVASSNTYELDYSQYLPIGTSLAYGVSGVTTRRFTQTNGTATGSTIKFVGGGTTALEIHGAGSRIVDTGEGEHLTTTNTFGLVTSPLPSDFNPESLGTLNGILNNESGESDTFTSSVTMRITTELTHDDEVLYLHMVPGGNNTLSCMTGSRTIVRRIPLKEPYPMQCHSQLSGQEYDFLNMSRMNLRRLQFSLRFADGSLVPARGHVSFSILFAVIE